MCTHALPKKHVSCDACTNTIGTTCSCGTYEHLALSISIAGWLIHTRPVGDFVFLCCQLLRACAHNYVVLVPVVDNCCNSHVNLLTDCTRLLAASQVMAQSPASCVNGGYGTSGTSGSCRSGRSGGRSSSCCCGSSSRSIGGGGSGSGCGCGSGCGSGSESSDGRSSSSGGGGGSISDSISGCTSRVGCASGDVNGAALRSPQWQHHQQCRCL